MPSTYRRPALLPDGGVLIVGASASGIQLADEIHRSGRPVTIAVGHHTRLPRRYRGRDILWWLDRMGVFAETVDNVYSDFERVVAGDRLEAKGLELAKGAKVVAALVTPAAKAITVRFAVK